MSKGSTTRQRILKICFDLIYKQGYQATSIDEIIKQTTLTKGAFYYHFKTKEIMGLALLQEFIGPALEKRVFHSLRHTTNFRLSIYKSIAELLEDTAFFDSRYGCPLVNLIEEMAPLNPKFSKVMADFYDDWHREIALSIQNNLNLCTTDLERSNQIATFIISGYHGIRSIGKLKGAPIYQSYLHELQNYLNTL